MGKFFDVFPKVSYDIAGNQFSTYQNVPNILFRVRMLREALATASAYHYYVIADGQTPELIAEQLYGDPEAHWIVLLANDIVDPQYDWPLHDRAFRKYIIGKYGSMAAAKSQIHHYEMVISREESFSGTVTETRFTVNEDKLTDNDLDVPYDTYTSLTETQSVETYDLGNGRTVVEITRREAITAYDYELAANEAKRPIRLIKKEYYDQILREFNDITDYAKIPFFRRLA